MMAMVNQPFNPSNWYFISTDGRLYSTASMSVVQPTEAGFQAWRSLGLTPLQWPGDTAEAQTDDSIRDMLQSYGYPVGTLSLRQFYQQLAVAGIITQAEALAIYAGTLPAVLEAVIAVMPADTQFDARMHLLGGYEVERQHPLVKVFAASQNMSPVVTDEFFRAAALL